MPPEWFGLNLNVALLTKVYWSYPTHIVRVCVSPLGPINPLLHLSKKCNLQVKFGSIAMTSLYDHLCYHSLTSADPLLEELLFIFLHVFTPISSIKLLTNTHRMMNQSLLLTHQFLHFIPTIQPIFIKYFFICLIFHATPKFLPRTDTRH